MRRTMTSSAPAKTAAAATTRWGAYAALAESLAREVVDATDPSPERASDVLSALGREWARRGGGGDAGVDVPSTIELLKVTGIGRALARAIRSCKRHGRASDEREGWEGAAKSGEGTLASPPLRAANEEARARSASAMTVAAAVGAATGVATGLPSSTAELFDGGGIGRQCTNQIKRSRVGGTR